MSRAKKPSTHTVLKFTAPQEHVGPQLLSWVRGVVTSHNELVIALERLHRSYKVLYAGNPVTDVEAVLWQVEGALQEAVRCKNILMSQTDCGPPGA